MQPAETFIGIVTEIIDGDSFKIDIDNFPAYFRPIEVRVLGIDTPEHIKPPAKNKREVKLGLAATAHAKTLISIGDIVTLNTDGIHKDKYGRLLGKVTLPNGLNFGDEMIKAGVARAYMGGTKEPW